MADYRLYCCGGFPDHKAGCPAIEIGRVVADRQKAEKQRAEMIWSVFFDAMTDEELFEYITKAEVEIGRADRFHRRHKAAMEYIRREKLLQGNSRFLDRLREWQKGYYASRNYRSSSQ